MTCLPFDSISGHKIYAGPCPINCADKFQSLDIKTAAVLLSDFDKQRIPIDAFYEARQVQQICCPIQDMGVPPSTAVILEFVGKIFKALEEGNVYLHCLGGRGRTGLVVACISILKKGLTGKEAIAFTRTLILGAIETPGQEQFIRQFNKEYGSQPDTTPSPRESRALVPVPAPRSDPSGYESMFKMLPFESSSGHKVFIGSRPSTMPEYFSAPHSERFKQEIQTAVVILEESDGTMPPIRHYYEKQQIEVIYFPIPSKDVPSSVEQMHQFMQLLFKALETGNVFLHCNTFQLRTGLILACMAVFKKAMTGDEANTFAGKFMFGLSTYAQKEFVQRFYQAYGSKEDSKAAPAPAARVLPRQSFSGHQLYDSAAFKLSNEFSQNLLPFKSQAGFELYAGPNLSKSFKKPEKVFKTVAILMTPEEIADTNVTEYYNLRGIKQIYLPIPDRKEKGPTPTAEQTLEFIDRMFQALEAGNVYLQCKSGIGRVAIMLACIAIVKNGMKESAAVDFAEKYILAGIAFEFEKDYVHQFYLDYKKRTEASSQGDAQ